MIITIERILNGAILHTIDGEDETKEGFVWDETNYQGLIDLLYTLLNMFESTSRHDRERITIQIVHGDKYECKDKKCKICKG
jgi:hypothetical protein